MKCPGTHCPGCGNGGAGLAALAITAGIGLAVWHAATSRAVEHAAGEALEIAAIGLVSAAGAVVLILAAVATVYLRTHARTRVRAVETARPALPAREPVRLVASRRVLPAGRPVLHSLSEPGRDRAAVPRGRAPRL